MPLLPPPSAPTWAPAGWDPESRLGAGRGNQRCKPSPGSSRKEAGLKPLTPLPAPSRLFTQLGPSLRHSPQSRVVRWTLASSHGGRGQATEPADGRAGKGARVWSRLLGVEANLDAEGLMTPGRGEAWPRVRGHPRGCPEGA